MRKYHFVFYLGLTLICKIGLCQGLELTTINTIYTIDFDNTVAGVNNGAFNGVNINPSPASGELNSNGWNIGPFSFPSVAAVFGTTSTSGGGFSSGNVSTATYYSFETTPGNRTVGFQVTDANPGFGNALRIKNNTGVTMTSLAISYKVFILNNTNAATYFGFDYSTDNSTYSQVQSDTSRLTSDVSPVWKAYLRSYIINGLSVPAGAFIYLKWYALEFTPAAVESDEIAWDDFSMVANPTTVFPRISGNFENMHIGGPVQLAGNTTVAGDIILSGYNIELGDYNLLIGGHAYSNSSGYIQTNGTGSVTLTNVTATARLVPLGVTTYNPLIISNGSGLNWTFRLDNGVANVVPPNNTDKAILRTWTITPSTNPPPAGADITFQYNDGDPTQVGSSFNNTEAVQVWHNDGATGWISASGGLTPTGTPGGIRRVTLSNWSDFSAFAISNISGALPVKFGPLKAVKTADGIKIKWTNYTESNIRYYRVERSADARNFIALVTLNPLLNNGAAIDYSSLDASPLAGNNFYRIAAVETNGTVIYSTVIRVNLDRSVPGILVFPNPASSSQVYLQLTDIPKGVYELKIINSSSQLIARKSFLHDGGSLVVSLNEENPLKPGFYIIELYNKETRLQNRFVVK